MRLIDADKLLELIKDQKEKGIGTYAKGINAGLNIVKSIINDKTQTPTAYDVDKVVEHLETARDGYSTAMCMTATNAELVKRFIAKDKAINLAIEIVKAGGMNNNSKTSD